MKLPRKNPVLILALVLTIATVAVPSARADLVGTVPTPPTATTFPGLVPSGTSAGTLLATESVPFTTSPGTSGILDAAVYRESGGTLDFYYQVFNNAKSIDSIARETDTNFSGFTTATGYRTDGSTLTGTSFVNGTVIPVTSDRNSVGDVVGFSFNPPDTAKIAPGQASDVFIISTNATRFTTGTAALIDGGSVNLSAYQPSAVPEPKILIPLAMGLLALVGTAKHRARRI
ncbi:MAG TPA: hypothetical protein VKT81_01480 [Bryobacteraceae bacterium]|nr:hypothetical protein [Bryobacteraceae bacterium]